MKKLLQIISLFILMITISSCESDHKAPEHPFITENNAKTITLKEVQDAINKGADVNYRLTDKSIKYGNRTPLMYASQYNSDTKIIELLLKHGSDINATDNNNNTPLLLAIRYNSNPKIAELLIQHHADIHMGDKNNKTPLMYATQYNANNKIIDLLLKHGANLDAISMEGYTTLMYASRFQGYNLVKLFLDHESDPNVKTDGSIHTVLEAASKYNTDLKVIKLLLDHGAKARDKASREFTDNKSLLLANKYNPNPKVTELLLKNDVWFDKDRGNSLFWVVKEGNPKVVEYLLNHGANTKWRSSDNETILESATRNEDPKVLEVLLDHGENIHEKQRLGETLLEYAIFYNNKNTAEVLLNRGLNVNNKDANGRTPLMNVIRYKNPTNYPLLTLLNHGADANIPYKNGLTVLNYVTKYIRNRDKQNEATELLLNHGADINLKNKAGETPLQYAIHMKKHDAVMILLKHGAKFYPTDKFSWKDLIVFTNTKTDFDIIKSFVLRGVNVNIKDDNGDNALLSILINNYEELDKSDILEFLCKHKLNLEQKNKHDKTALMDSVGRNSDVKTIKLLLDHGANINAKDQDGNTVLMYAVLYDTLNTSPNSKDNDKFRKMYEKEAKTLELLLTRGANINAKDKRGLTALMYASCSINLKLAEILLNHGANINAKSKIGATALTFATYNTSPKLAEILLNHGANINSKGQGGVTVLMYAVDYAKNNKTLELLLNHGANINAKDKKGETPLMYAVNYAKNNKILEFLLNHGANIHAKDKKGGTALTYSEKNKKKYPEVYNFLRNYIKSHP